MTANETSETEGMVRGAGAWAGPHPEPAPVSGAATDDASLRDHAVLVVGATGVLGSLLAERLAAAGARVALHGRDEGRLAQVAETGPTVVGDLDDPDTAERVVREATEALGGLDGLVIAAGAVGFDSATDAGRNDLETLFSINALAPIRLISAALPALMSSKEQGRAPFVLTMTGIVTELPTAGLASYSASKAALAAFMAASARELRRSGIRLLDSRQGHTETGLADRPLFGTPPKFPQGHEPGAVADRIMAALATGETELPSTAFRGA